MQIVANEEQLRHYLRTAVEIDEDKPVLVDKYIQGREVEIDAICDGINVFVPGIMELVERTGVHSGDSISVYPSFSISNKVKGMTKAQLKDVFAGKIANWKELGGADAPISLYTREDGSGTRETFEGRALDKGTAAASANVVSSNGAMKTAIAQDPNAIGYVGIGHLDPSIQGMAIDGMIPSQENAANGSYKITRLLYMNTKGEPTGLTKAFVDYIYSPDGQKFTSASGYIPKGRD